MGQSFSFQSVDLLELNAISDTNGLESQFLRLPPHILIPLIQKLCPKDRQLLRTVCFQLALEIDTWACSGVDVLILNDRKSTKALEFFKGIYIPRVQISESCLLLPFGAGIMDTQKIKSLNFDSKGILYPDYVSSIFHASKSLQELKWSGVVKGSIVSDKVFLLPKVEYLSINTTSMANSHVLETSRKCLKYLWSNLPFRHETLLKFRENQLTLLNKIHCPQLKKMKIHLCTFFNLDFDVADHTELVRALFTFITRHKECKTIKIGHNLIGTIVPSEVQNQAHSYGRRYCIVGDKLDETVWNEIFFDLGRHLLSNSLRHYAVEEDPTLLEIAPLGDIPDNLQIESKAERLSLKFMGSRVQRTLMGNVYQNIDTMMTPYLINSLNKFTCLKFLKVELEPSLPCRGIQWHIIYRVMLYCYRSLEHCEVTGQIIGPIDLRSMEFTTKLKVLKITYRKNNAPDTVNGNPNHSPFIHNFGPYKEMCQNLEVLLLKNVALKPEDLARVKYLRRLKYIFLVGWNGPGGHIAINLTGMQNLLNMRSLQGMIVPMKIHHDTTERKETLKKIFENLYGNLYQYGTTSYMCLVDENKFSATLESEG